MGRYMMFTLLFALHNTLTVCNQEQLVCKTIPQGPLEMVGSPGIRGQPGNPGSPGSVDYDGINEFISAKVASALGDIHSRIGFIEDILRSPLSANPANRCLGGLEYRGKCYTIPHISTSADMNYDQAIAECAKTGALLAEIHDRSEQQALYDFALSKKPQSRSVVDLYIGMEYQSVTSTLFLRSRQQILASQL